MTQNIKKNNETPKMKKDFSLLNTVVVLLFPFLMIITPHTITIDASGSKFFALSIYNITIIAYLLYKKRDDFIGFLTQLFSSSLLFKVYITFIIWALITFIVAYNVIESWLTFSKMSQVFISALLIAYFTAKDKKIILNISIGVTILLLIDASQGILGLMELAKGNITNPYFIKFIYSNKNIFAAALFIKIPFAVYILLNASKYWRYFTWLVLFLTIISLLTLRTKAFFLGFGVLTLLYWIYFAIYGKNKLKSISFSLVIILLAIGFYTVVFNLTSANRNKNKDVTIETSLSKISVNSESAQARFRNWSWSADMIKNSPFLGVGIGNWKIESVKYDMLRDANQIAYKNHNDFLEITAETGIIGGALFLLIFGLVFYKGYEAISNKKTANFSLDLLPIFGLIAYSVDAFFNFPHDRPEIQALFALIIGIALSFDTKTSSSEKTNYFVKISLLLGLAILALPSFYVLYQNYTSLKLQKIIFNDSNLERKDMDIVSLYAKLPPIPSLAHMGEPILLQKARYLINEGKLNAALQTLKQENSNPYNMNKYYLIANIYVRQQKNDSAYLYLHKVIKNNPLNFLSNLQLTYLYNADKKNDSAILLWEKYLERKSDNPKVYVQIINAFILKGDWNSALNYAEEAKKKFPKDNEIIELYDKTKKTQLIQPYIDKIKEAENAFFSKNYTKALTLANDLVQKIPEHTKMLELRAFIHYQLGHYQETINDAESVLAKSTKTNAPVMNVKGLAYIKMGDIHKGCTELKNAKSIGDKNATNNYKLFCSDVAETTLEKPTKPNINISKKTIPAPNFINKEQ